MPRAIAHNLFPIITLPQCTGKWRPPVLFDPTNVFIGYHGFEPLPHAVTTMHGVGQADKCIAFNSRAFVGQFGVSTPNRQVGVIFIGRMRAAQVKLKFTHDETPNEY